MKDIFAREKKFIFLLMSLFAGICISLILYIVFYNIWNQPFTFKSFFELHRSNPLIFVADFFPIVSIIAGIILFNSLHSGYSILRDKLIRERKKIEQAIHISGDLAQGKLSSFDNSKIISDELTNSLNELRETLVKNKEAEEARARDDNKRNWASEGLAMYGELLRLQEDKMEDLAYKLISNLVKYLKANQGGFFLIEEESDGSKYLQMIACHAYDRKKFADKRIEWGEGLIGTCALEKKTIYLLDIPDQYLSITSGLGKANPNVLVLVPLLANDEVHGILEIASFSKFESYQVDFIEKVAESIAMTLSSIKGNLKTARLLKETQAQAEELVIQEERVRQNIEELKATQEEAARQADKFISFTNSVNHTMIRAEYDKGGTLLYANTKFLKKLGYSGNREVEGRHISLFIHEKDRVWFNEIWESLAKGGKHFEGYMKHITKQGLDLWTMATYTSVRKDDGSVERILFLAIDTTEHKKQSLDFEGQISAINRLNLKAEFAPDGKLLSANELFINVLKYNDREVQQMNVFDFIYPKDLETFNETWELVTTGDPYQGQTRLISKYEEEKWFRASFSAVHDMYNEVAKVVFMANEITNEKIMESESRRQTEQLKQQEEKLRLAAIDLNRKLEEKNQEWKIQKEEFILEKDILKDIIYNTSDLIISFENTGILNLVNRSAEGFWGIKSRDMIGKPALELFKEVPQFPSILLNLMDPAKSKVFDSGELELTNLKGKHFNKKTKLHSKETGGKIIYTLFLYD